MVLTGANESIKWGFEDTFGTLSTSLSEVGIGAKASFSTSTNNTELYGVGTRKPFGIEFNNFEGEGEIDFYLDEGMNFDLFKAILGNKDASGNYVVDKLPSISIQIAEDNTNTINLLGAVVDSFGITISKDNPYIQSKISIKYATFSLDTTNNNYTASSLTNPFVVNNVSLTIGGTAYTIEELDLTINNNVELLQTVGNTHPITAFAKQFNGTLTIKLPMEDFNEFLEVMDNDKSFVITISGSTKTITMNITGVYNKVDRDASTSEDKLEQSIEVKIKDISISVA